VLLVAVTLAAAELSMRLLLIASQLTGKRSYEELARHAYGRAGAWAVDVCVVAMNVGSVVAYLNILTDTISSVAGQRGVTGEVVGRAGKGVALSRCPTPADSLRPPPPGQAR
jgi:amino acid permease